MASQTRIAELAEIISTNTAIVDGYIREHGVPSPSFEPDEPSSIAIPLSKEVTDAQAEVISSTQELHNLMKGPTEMLMGIGVSR